MKNFFNLIIYHFLFLAFISIALGQDNDKLRIALLDFGNTGGLSQQESVTLTNRLRSMLVKTKAFIVLERGAMDEILDEQGFQQTGCSTTECAVELGKLLNVQKMISGSIGKIGRTYTIDLSLIDVGTAQIEKSFIRDYKGEIDGLLAIMERVANEIASLQVEETKPTIPKQRFPLVIRSIPPSASVFINNKEVGKTTYNGEFDEGERLSIKLKRQYFKDWEDYITISKDEQIIATLELTEAYKEALAKKKEEESKPETITTAEAGGSGSTWWWIAGGAVVAGGVVFLVSQGGDDGGDDGGQTGFPNPPGRPN